MVTCSLQQGDFASKHHRHLAMYRDVVVVAAGGWALASRSSRPRILLNILQGAGQPATPTQSYLIHNDSSVEFENSVAPRHRRQKNFWGLIGIWDGV